MLNKIINIFLPKESPQRKLVKKILVIAKIKNPYLGGYYNLWMNQQRLQPPLREVDPEVEGANVLISIVVPVYNPAEKHFAELIYSVMAQSYPNWELILTDASTDTAAQQRTADYALRDKRIKVFSNNTKGISNNTNHGIKQVKGDYVVFCDNDDVLDPFALYEFVKVIISEKADFIYSDEDKISDDSEVYFDPHYKPDWSPDLFTHVNYVNHLSAIKRTVLDEVGYLDPKKDGAQDYDLMLRVTDQDVKIVHIPKVLYHWRSTKGSTAQDFGSKKNVTDAGVSALSEHFERKGVDVSVTSQHNRPGFYDLAFTPYKKIAVIVEPFASEAVLNLFTKVLIARTDTTADIDLIVPFASTMNVTVPKNIKITHLENTASYLRDALSKAGGEVVVSFSQPYLPRSKQWPQTLTSVLRQGHIKAVAPVVIQEDGTVQDCGLVYNADHTLARLFKGQSATNNQTFFGNTSWVRNVDGLGGVVATRKKELLAFVDTIDENQRLDKVTLFTLNPEQNPAFNTIYTPEVFDANSIEVMPHSWSSAHSYFNTNLTESLSGGYILYSPESTIINILMRLAEREGIPL